MSIFFKTNQFIIFPNLLTHFRKFQHVGKAWDTSIFFKISKCLSYKYK